MRKRKLIGQTGAILALAFFWGSLLQTSGAEADPSTARSPQQTPSPPTRVLSANRTVFYGVPLVCPAAPAIGCGSAAKPLLRELESSSNVTEAWLNRAGTLLAIVWSEHSTAKQRSQTMGSCFKEREIAPKPLSGDAKRRAWKEFETGTGWYRGAAVDQLSEEEAVVIAHRWVGRIRQKIDVPDAQAELLQKGFTSVVRQKLLGQITRAKAQEEMVGVCRQHLNEKDVARLQDAFAEELRGSAPAQ